MCREALAEDEDDPYAHHLLGLSLGAIGRLDEAEQALRDAIGLEPTSEEAFLWHQDLGDTYLMRSKYELALEECLQAIAFRSNYSNIHSVVSQLMALDPESTYFSPEKSLRHAQKALELDSERGLAWRALGWAKYRQGDAQGCIEAIEKSMELDDGGDGRHWLFLAMACWKVGRREEARGWYERAAEALPAERVGCQDLYHLRDEAAALLGVSTAPDEAVPDEAP